MAAATWITALGTSAAVLMGLVAMWTRVNTRITAMSTELAAMRATLRRIEDAIWAQAGIAVLQANDKRRS